MREFASRMKVHLSLPKRLAFFVFISLFMPAAAHNWMTYPPPYQRVFRARDCRGRQCTDACPPKWAYGMNNSQVEPAVVWKRGQTIDITWAKNNHHGGFVRIALVPVDKMWDRAWHEKMALVYGCWDSGWHKCRPDEDCGTDFSGEALGRKITIPSTFPNGDYVLGYVWYGGLYYNSRKGFFPDFYSCSHVRIAGGKPLGGTYRAFFDPGTGPRVKRPKCRTSADSVGDCEITGCPNRKSFWAIPKVFKNGQPAEITPEIISTGFEVHPSGGGDAVGGISPNYSVSPDPKSTGKGYVEERYGEANGPSEGITDKGICRGHICCASSCGQCGGAKCQLRKGGAAKCCMGNIIRSKQYCSTTIGAPCIRA